MHDSILSDLKDKSDKSLLHLKSEFTKILLNKPNINLLKSIKIIYYNIVYTLDQISVINVEKGNVIIVKPFDKQNIPKICNEIIKLNLDINPFVTQDFIRVVFPMITSDRRELFVKKIKKIGEDTKISIRNIRRQTNQEIKDLLKSNKLTQDDEKRLNNETQKIINNYIEKIDLIVNKKEHEILNI
jgi:ribosome recycling factor